MTTILLRPDLKTSGGEIHDILLDGRYAGNMTLVYRERDRIGGAVQLDQTALSASDKEEVVRFIQNYIQDLITAVRAADCDIIVTNSRYDHIISTSRDEAGRAKEMDEAAESFEDDDIVPVFDDDEDDDEGRIEMGLELVIVGESRNKVEYHVYDQDENWIAEALFTIQGMDVLGEIHFTELPGEDLIEAVTDLIVSDFDDDAVDTFEISVIHQGIELERIELTHEDLLETPSYVIGEEDDAQLSVTLARDDGDMLTYEIYHSRRGALPIGTATIDISQRQLTGFIDISEDVTEEEREQIASLLMRELDKEKDYNSLNLSVMLGNQKIDELMYESVQVH